MSEDYPPNYFKSNIPDYEIKYACLGCIEKDKRIAELEQELASITLERKARITECGTCGRTCLPDGDCYGCECDRLGLENQRLRDEIIRLRKYEPAAFRGGK